MINDKQFKSKDTFEREMKPAHQPDSMKRLGAHLTSRDKINQNKQVVASTAKRLFKAHVTEYVNLRINEALLPILKTMNKNTDLKKMFLKMEAVAIGILGETFEEDKAVVFGKMMIDNIVQEMLNKVKES